MLHSPVGEAVVCGGHPRTQRTSGRLSSEVRDRKPALHRPWPQLGASTTAVRGGSAQEPREPERSFDEAKTILRTYAGQALGYRRTRGLAPTRSKICPALWMLADHQGF
jgi:hypothetical protein